MDRKDFGAWVKKNRVKNKMTQASLAEKLGLKYSQEVNNIESGSVLLPVKKIPLLAEALSVDKEKIFQMTMKIKEAELRLKMNEE
jgi:transcriptional regulator with XRE-family HTH domain